MLQTFPTDTGGFHTLLTIGLTEIFLAAWAYGHNTITGARRSIQHTILISVGTVLIFQFSPGFGSEASVPEDSRYRFWYLGSGSFCWIPGFLYKVFRGYLHFSNFGTGLVPFRCHFGSKSGGT